MAVAVTPVPLVGVTVSVYVVVVVGFTVTAVPLVAGRLPGVMTPVPFAKTPVRVALDPFVMEVGFAVKLLIEGGGGVGVLDDPPPQAVKPAKPRLRVMASGARTRRRFMGFPVSWSGRSQRRCFRVLPVKPKNSIPGIGVATSLI
jgi:hypothetical protein